MTNWKLLCSDLLSDLECIAPMAYDITSDDEEECNLAYGLLAKIRSARAALEDDTAC